MTAVDELELLRTSAGVVDRSDRGAVLVTGPDAFSFLQALVSADLDPVLDGHGVSSLLLTPHGQARRRLPTAPRRRRRVARLRSRHG